MTTGAIFPKTEKIRTSEVQGYYFGIIVRNIHYNILLILFKQKNVIPSHKFTLNNEALI